jgi:hypothetical protein
MFDRAANFPIFIPLEKVWFTISTLKALDLEISQFSLA